MILRFGVSFFGFFSYEQRIEASSTVSSMVTGSYLGNGSDDRAITGIGFQPDLVIVKANAAAYAVFKTSDMSGDASKPTIGTITTNLIQSFDSNGFTVGTDATVNTSGTTYYWTAFKATPGVLKVSTYTGNGTSQSLAGFGFSPESALCSQLPLGFTGSKVCAQFEGRQVVSNGLASFKYRDCNVGFAHRRSRRSCRIVLWIEWRQQRVGPTKLGARRYFRDSHDEHPSRLLFQSACVCAADRRTGPRDP